MIGGAYLCYEGLEKLAHKFLHSKGEDDTRHREMLEAMADPSVDLVVLEKERVKGAMRTDLILSAEIIMIALGTVAKATFAKQVAVLVSIAVLLSVGLCGLVAAIVRLYDAGLYLSRTPGAGPIAVLKRRIGRGILIAAPWLIKFLSIAGTAAMFLVGGAILTLGVPALHHWIEQAAQAAGSFAGIAATFADGVISVAAGAAVLAGVTLATKIFKKTPSETA